MEETGAMGAAATTGEAMAEGESSTCRGDEVARIVTFRGQALTSSRMDSTEAVTAALPLDCP
jgi:hypothetical protein